MLDIAVRDFRPSDSDDVRRLVASVLAEFGLDLDPNGIDRDLDDITASYQQRGGAFKVLVERGADIVGCGGLYPMNEGKAEIRKMYFVSFIRGQGLGRALLNDLIAHARARGFSRVTLETASVLKSAIALYRGYGFVPLQRAHITDRCDQAYYLEL